MKAKWWHLPIKALDNFLDRVASILGAFILIQFPQFFSQYLQRLGGHLDEARQTVDLYTSTANSLEMTINEFIDTHLQAANPVFVSSGEKISQIANRFYSLENSFLALDGASPFTRLWIFVKEVDWEIARQAWRNFTPGIPTNLEGLLYALLGLLLGWGLYSMAKGFLCLIKGLFTRKEKFEEDLTLSL